MTNELKYRHEMKYVISDTEFMLLMHRIKCIMPIDSHVKKDGEYNIRSVYFDTYDNRCYYENESGTDPREKFRIRIYNASSERISLECKRKERGKTLKTSAKISKEQCDILLSGGCLSDFENQDPLINKLSLKIIQEKMHPVVIVDYDRVPYVYKIGNVRITFDKNVSSSTKIEDFFRERIKKRPVMPVGYKLIEVKYDEYLPDQIYRALQIENLRQTAYSKYYLCRKFSI